MFTADGVGVWLKVQMRGFFCLLYLFSIEQMGKQTDIARYIPIYTLSLFLFPPYRTALVCRAQSTGCGGGGSLESISLTCNKYWTPLEQGFPSIGFGHNSFVFRVTAVTHSPKPRVLLILLPLQATFKLSRRFRKKYLLELSDNSTCC